MPTNEAARQQHLRLWETIARYEAIRRIADMPGAELMTSTPSERIFATVSSLEPPSTMMRRAILSAEEMTQTEAWLRHHLGKS